jgi:hypothetical protein
MNFWANPLNRANPVISRQNFFLAPAESIRPGVLVWPRRHPVPPHSRPRSKNVENNPMQSSPIPPAPMSGPAKTF